MLAVSSALWAATVIITGWLLLAYSLPQDLLRRNEPYATLVAISFFGRVLTFHLGLMMVAVAISATILRRKRLSLLAGALSVICLFPTLRSLLPHETPKTSGPMLRIMSMNLKYTHEHGELITNQIQKFNPDVLLIQDFTPFAQSIIEQAVGDSYPHRHLYHNALQGLAIYSRLPFDGTRAQTTFTKTRRQMRTVILFNGRPIVIYVEHPFSPRSKPRILNNRAATVDLVNQVRAETLPVILAGDFNFTDATPNESALKAAGLQDGFELAGRGRGSTWPVEPKWMQWLPGVRIDHVFFSSQLMCTGFTVGDYDGSDHLPVIADIAIVR